MPAKKMERTNLRLATSKKSDDLELAKRDLYDLVSLLQSTFEDIARRAFICFDHRPGLIAGQRENLLCQDSRACPGTFEEQQAALLEEMNRLRELLSYLAGIRSTSPKPEEALRLMMILKDCSRESDDHEHDPHWDGADPFQIAAQIMFVWNQLLRLCDLDDLSAPVFSSDTPDLVAGAAARAVPSERRIESIVAAGTTTISLLKLFCDYRGIETR